MTIYRYKNSKVWWMDFIFDFPYESASQPKHGTSVKARLKQAILRNWRCREIFPVFHRVSREPNGIKYAVGDLDAYFAASRHVPSVRASVERYGLKELEPFFGYERQQALKDVGPHKRGIEHQLELFHSPALTIESKEIVERYKRVSKRVWA